MDLARPEFKRQKRRRQVIWGSIGVFCLVGVTVGLSHLKPAAPEVERNTVLTDTVKRGPMLRQVRGLGSLIPGQEFTRQIPAETEATVVRILKLPGSQVTADTFLIEMNNPEVAQVAIDAKLQLKAAKAEYESLGVKLQSDLMNQEAAAATVNAEYSQARRQADLDKALFEAGQIAELAYKNSQTKAEELTTRHEIEVERLKIDKQAIESQLAEARAKVERFQTLAELKARQLHALKVRATIDGILVDLPLQVGQRVSPGTMLAKVVQPDHLIAEIKVAETQARDIQIGQPALVDTHNGTVSGTVMRVDPAVQNGTVTIDLRLIGEMPKGARPDLSVEGTIDLERLENTLYVARPAVGQENSTISLFKVDTEGKGASRVTVKVGRASVNSIQVLGGLNDGDTVILSDMSRYDNTDRIRLN